MKALKNLRSKVENKVMGIVAKVKNNDGEFFIDKGVAIIIVIAVGVIVLGLMDTAWTTTIMPNLASKITEMFG